MIRLLKYLLLALIAVALLIIALANRSVVTLHLLPDNMGTFLGFGWSIDLPFFMVIFGGVAVGLLIGFVWEWFREHKHRTAAVTRTREIARLEREVSKLRDAKAEPNDEVLALIQDKRKAS